MAEAEAADAAWPFALLRQARRSITVAADAKGAGFGYLPLDEAFERFASDAVVIPEEGLGLWRS